MRPERRRRRRRDTKMVRAVTSIHATVQAILSRTAQAVAGILVSACGGGALYVVRDRQVANAATNAMDWAFFGLGTLLLLGGLGIAINGPFWRSLAMAAEIADGIWDTVRGNIRGS